MLLILVNNSFIGLDWIYAIPSFDPDYCINLSLSNRRIQMYRFRLLSDIIGFAFRIPDPYSDSRFWNCSQALRVILKSEHVVKSDQS